MNFNLDAVTAFISLYGLKLIAAVLIFYIGRVVVAGESGVNFVVRAWAKS